MSTSSVNSPIAAQAQIQAQAQAQAQAQVNADALAFCLPSSQAHKLNFEFSLEDHIKKMRKAAAYLKQLNHSKTCGGACGGQYCGRIVQIIGHVSSCAMQICPFPGCMTTKRLVEHSNQCGTGNSTSVRTTGTFCLLCTIAASDSQDNIRDRTASCEVTKDMDVDDGYAPLIHDEIIEFSRVPFQAFSESPEGFSRQKTYSESHVLLALDQPSKKQKIRSKSLNIPRSEDE